jgi:autotransporter-associated beta strand protein
MREFVIDQVEDTTFDGEMNGNLKIVKKGTGTLKLLGASNVAGESTIMGGTLELVEGELNGALRVESGGQLKGFGFVGDVTVTGGGRLKPGSEVGVLNTGDLTMLGASTLEIDLDGPGTQYDQVRVAGTVTLHGNVSLEIGLGYQPLSSDKFTIIANNQFDPLTPGGWFSYGGNKLDNNETFFVQDGAFSQWFKIQYDGDQGNGGQGNDVVLTPVPEPCVGGLLLGGLACLLGRRRRVANS